MRDSSRTRTVGFILYPDLTQLDLTGPWEVFTRIPHTICHLLSKDLAPVRSASGLSILPTLRYADCEELDVIVVPGGPGHLEAMSDQEILQFLRHQAPGCELLAAVCTGTLILGAAGLLAGRNCTTHWTALHRLETFGARTVRSRVVFDGNLVTCGGVTAGIDLGLCIAAKLEGEDAGRKIQLQMEYEPEPPFKGSPATADVATVEALRDPPAEIAQRIKEIDLAALEALSRV